MERKGKRTGVIGKIMAGIAAAFHAVAKQAKMQPEGVDLPGRYEAKPCRVPCCGLGRAWKAVGK